MVDTSILPGTTDEHQTNTNKQLVSAQPLLMPLKTEERSLCDRCHTMKWRGFTQLHSDRPPLSPRSVDSLF